MTSKEINAVDSEHEKNKNNMSRRLWELHKSMAVPESPLWHFYTGNKETLDRKFNSP